MEFHSDIYVHTHTYKDVDILALMDLILIMLNYM